MYRSFFQRSISIFTQRQTNILSAALIIMITIILSQILGIIRQRLLISIFGASDITGIYLASARLPDFLFQLIIAGALSSAFIPIFSDYLAEARDEDAHRMASTLLTIGMFIFSAISIVLFIFAPFFLQLFNVGSGFSLSQMHLMANLMRIILFGQLIFIIGSFFSALLQSYNHFLIPGLAGAFYNMGIIIGIVALSGSIGIYAPAIGIIFGSIFFIIVQIPLVRKIGFSFIPSLSFSDSGIIEVSRLMWPRTISIGVYQLGTLITVTMISFLSTPGRNYVILDYAQTIAFAPVALIGQAIAQAAFPVLSRERTRLESFKKIFMTSFNQLAYLVLPFSVLLLVLRIPIVRILYGVPQFDWGATLLTGKTLAVLTFSISAQALICLVSRAFYALHDSKTPLFIGTLSTLLMIILGFILIIYYKLGIEGIALAYSVSSIINLVLLMIFLNKKVNGFNKIEILVSLSKIFLATICTGYAIYIPIKLLDQLVLDTTHTINLLIITAIASFIGLCIYLFLTWFLNVKEAFTFLLLFRKLGNWREILQNSDEAIGATRL